MKGFNEELTGNILPFWINKMQDINNGGFYGCIDGNNTLHQNANKGAILNSRILWTFSAAYCLLKKPEYKKIAERAFEYMKDFFIDKTNGGIYWELDYKGYPVNRKKQTYVQAFALYGFSEFYRATGNIESLKISKELFFLIEKFKDNQSGGYYEAFSENWNPIEDVRLSIKDANEKKTMNTHLHVLESYTNLGRIWENEKLINARHELIGIFTGRILNKESNHLNLFFNERWDVKSSVISYGHDIEASWLLVEAAEELGGIDLIQSIKTLSLKIVDATIEGFESDGSLIYEMDGAQKNRDRHWWVQAEAVVGLMHAYKNSGNIKYKLLAQKTWNYIQNQLIDNENGEWFWSRGSDNSINRTDDKAGFWKCPYHNSRMCLMMQYPI